jgi:hypothetical protein
MIAADYLKLPRGIGGFSEALIFVDFFTCYVWGVILKQSGTGAFSANALQTICLQWQAPKRLLTDGGSHFRGPEMATLLRDFSIEHEVTPAYSPHCNGLIENENKQILAVLSKECAAELPDQIDAITTLWPKLWPRALSLVNECRTPVLNTSPKVIMFGTIDGSFDIDDLINLDFDVGTRFVFLEADRDVTREHMRELQRKQKTWFDKKSKPQSFQPGDFVLVHNSKLDTSHESKFKLSAPWLGPFKVRERSNNWYYLESLSGHQSSGRVHVNCLKRFHMHANSVPVPDTPSADQLNILSELPHDPEEDTVPEVSLPEGNIKSNNEETLSEEVLEQADDLYEPIGHCLAK